MSSLFSKNEFSIEIRNRHLMTLSSNNVAKICKSRFNKRFESFLIEKLRITFVVQLHETEHLYESRKAFHNRFETFEKNVRDIAEQIENHGQIQTATWNQTLQRLQQIQKQFQSIQPLLSAVGHELAELEVAGIPKIELQTIENTYEAHRQRLNT